MTALGDRIAAAKRHPADLTYSEWVELLEDVEKELRALAIDALLAERVAEGHLPTLAPEIGLHAIGRLYAADVQPIPDSHDVEWLRGRITLGVAVEPQSIPVRMGATYVIAQVVHP